MKIPEQFMLLISTKLRSHAGTYFVGRKKKYLLEKVPIKLSFAKNLYNGGRYSNNNQFQIQIKELKNYKEEVREIVLIFKKIQK